MCFMGPMKHIYKKSCTNHVSCVLYMQDAEGCRTHKNVERAPFLKEVHKLSWLKEE